MTLETQVEVLSPEVIKLLAPVCEDAPAPAVGDVASTEEQEDGDVFKAYLDAQVNDDFLKLVENIENCAN